MFIPITLIKLIQLVKLDWTGAIYPSSKPISYIQYLLRIPAPEMLILSDRQIGCFHSELYAAVEVSIFDNGSLNRGMHMERGEVVMLVMCNFTKL
jgi:hypothetical protein